MVRGPEKVGNEGYDNHKFPVSGSYQTDVSGDLILEFSNLHSRFFKKQIDYHVSVVKEGNSASESLVPLTQSPYCSI